MYVTTLLNEINEFNKIALSLNEAEFSPNLKVTMNNLINIINLHEGAQLIDLD